MGWKEVLETAVLDKCLWFDVPCCWYCGSPLPVTDRGGWHIEHQEPRSRGGMHGLSNMVAACPTCNLRKRSMTVEEFRTRLRKEFEASLSAALHLVQALAPRSNERETSLRALAAHLLFFIDHEMPGLLHSFYGECERPVGPLDEDEGA
jgi:hypothetical protein